MPTRWHAPRSLDDALAILAACAFAALALERLGYRVLEPAA